MSGVLATLHFQRPSRRLECSRLRMPPTLRTRRTQAHRHRLLANIEPGDPIEHDLHGSSRTRRKRPSPRHESGGTSARTQTHGWVGPRRPVSVAAGGFPRTARRTRRAPFNAPGSPRVVIVGQPSRGGYRCRCPRGGDPAAAVAVAGHCDAGCAGEHDPVIGEPPSLIAETAA